MTNTSFETWKKRNLHLSNLSEEELWRAFYIEESNRIVNEEMRSFYSKKSSVTGAGGGSFIVSSFDSTFDFTF